MKRRNMPVSSNTWSYELLWQHGYTVYYHSLDGSTVSTLRLTQRHRQTNKQIRQTDRQLLSGYTINSSILAKCWVFGPLCTLCV